MPATANFYLRRIALVVILLLFACSPQPQRRVPSGPLTLVDYLQAYNAYATGQLYLKRGQHAEALVEYQQSLQQFARFDDATRRLYRDEYGLTQAQVERELAIAKTLAQQTTASKGKGAELEQFREQVLAGFYPYGRGTPTSGEVKPGTSISQDNWQVAQGLLPDELLELLKNGQFSIDVQETTDLPPRDDYVVATMGAGDQVQLTADGELTGYVAGLPFPVLDSADPHAGFKVAWNLQYRDAGDRVEQWSDTVVLDRTGAKTRGFSSYDARLCGMYRTKPQHNLDEWEQQHVVCKTVSQFFGLSNLGAPIHDSATKGNVPRNQSFLALRHRYASDHRPIGLWVVMPGSGKLKSFAYNPEASARGATAINEDVAGGQISTHQRRLLASRVALVPGFVQNAQTAFGGTGSAYPMSAWELRQVHIVELVPRSSHHPYSRKILYVDQQTFVPFYTIIFNEKGEHWRTTLLSYGNPGFYPENREAAVPILLGYTSIDHQAGYAAVTSVSKAIYDQPLSPDLFTFSSLQQRGQ